MQCERGIKARAALLVVECECEWMDGDRQWIEKCEFLESNIILFT